MSAAVSYERVRDQLQQLKLEAALGALDPVLEQAQKAEKLTVPVLDELLGIEGLLSHAPRPGDPLSGPPRREPIGPAAPEALPDHPLHHATTLNIRGESYRLRHRRQAGLTTPPLSA
jgi:hypothetical protein